MKRPHTNFTNEIQGHTHYDKQPFFDGFSKSVAVAVGVMILLCGVIYWVAF